MWIDSKFMSTDFEIISNGVRIHKDTFLCHPINRLEKLIEYVFFWYHSFAFIKCETAFSAAT